jgi:SAM-dependent methyltransferase
MNFGVPTARHGKFGQMIDKKQQGVAREFDAYRDNYSDAVNQALLLPGLDVDYFTKVKAEYLKDIVRAMLGNSSSQRVLDVGCGIGNYHGLLKGAFRDLVGIDVSTQCIERARKENTHVSYDVYEGDVLPYADATFDAAYTICVMHHVPTSQWSNFVSEMYRILRPGGIGLIFEHNPLNPLTLRVVNRCSFDRDAVLLEPRQVRSLLATAGFGSVYSRTIINIPSIGRLTRVLDRSIFGALPFGAQYIGIGRK